MTLYLNNGGKFSFEKNNGKIQVVCYRFWRRTVDKEHPSTNEILNVPLMRFKTFKIPQLLRRAVFII